MNILEKSSLIEVVADMDYRLYRGTLPVLSGRITPKRADIIKRAVDSINKNLAAPFGFSPEGYKYTCGHDHDCCGCMHRSQIIIWFVSKHELNNPEKTDVYIEYAEYYNY